MREVDRIEVGETRDVHQAGVGDRDRSHREHCETGPPLEGELSPESVTSVRQIEERSFSRIRFLRWASPSSPTRVESRLSLGELAHANQNSPARHQ